MKPFVPLSELSAFLLAITLLPSTANALYSKSSPVLQIDGKSYRDLIEKSNYSSIVEFYAPWCGHCKNLAPAYNKAATSLAGLANVAAVNCDEENNKPFCGQMGVQGFPTLKLVKPGGVKKDGKKTKPVVSDYQGPREAKDIIAAVKDKMPNHVTRIKDDNLDKWLDSDKPKGLVFGDKGLVPPLAKAIAIDFLGQIDIGYARNSDKKAVKQYGVTKFPTVILIPGKGKDPITFDGSVGKAELVEFFSQAATPNPDATKSTAKESSTKKTKKAAPKKAKAEKPPAAKKDEKVEDSDPLESPSPDASEDKPKPVSVPADPAPQLVTLDSESALQKSCLNSRSGTCVLAIVPAAKGEDAEKGPLSAPLLTSLGEIAHKHASSGRKLFPIYAVPEGNGVAEALLKGLGLKSGEEKPVLLAVNAKRSWWTQYEESEIQGRKLEGWIDNIRFGEHKKEKLASSLVSEAKKEAVKEEAQEAEAVKEEAQEVEASKGEEDLHDEL